MFTPSQRPFPPPDMHARSSLPTTLYPSSNPREPCFIFSTPYLSTVCVLTVSPDGSCAYTSPPPPPHTHLAALSALCSTA